jgi:hypothetical protein
MGEAFNIVIPFEAGARRGGALPPMTQGRASGPLADMSASKKPP